MKVLFFAPHSAIWLHAFPEALVVRALQQEQVEVIYVTCGEVFQMGCIPMRSYGILQEAAKVNKQRICTICVAHAQVLRSELDLRGPILSDRLTAAELAEVEQRVTSATPDNYRTLQLDGLPIGQIALYEFLLQHKRISLSFSEQEWGRYCIALRNTLRAFFASRRILDEERPDALISYNNLYSVNRVSALLAEQRGIRNYFIHGSGNLSENRHSLLLGQEQAFAFAKYLIQRWPRYRDLPCASTSLTRITNHFLELLRGQSKFVYSAKKSTRGLNLRERFDLSPNSKIVVALMSSYDESFAAEALSVLPEYSDAIFLRQTDWLTALIAFAQRRADLSVIIRVHPREFPNKREGVKSEHVRQLEQLFRDLPSNVRINWPTDEISLYDLMEETDVFLNAWSGSGKEMSLFGLPVVVYSQGLIYYPAELNYLARTHEEYFEMIDRALVEGWSFERIRQTYRWHVLEFERCAINLSNAFAPAGDWGNLLARAAHLVARRSPIPFPTTLSTPLWQLWPSQDLRRAKKQPSPHGLRAFIESDQPALLDSPATTVPQVSLEEETVAIKHEVQRLVQALYPSMTTPPRPGTLRAKLLAALE